jgi:hypothetical protein
MSIYLSSDLITLEEFKRITKMKIVFEGMRIPSIFGSSGGQAFLTRTSNKITHRSTYQSASSPPRNKSPHHQTAEKFQSPGVLSSQVPRLITVL